VEKIIKEKIKEIDNQIKLVHCGCVITGRKIKVRKNIS
jgi:hypothetical protein